MSEPEKATIPAALMHLGPQARPRLSLAERLVQAFDDETLVDGRRADTERERWDDDEGSSGG